MCEAYSWNKTILDPVIFVIENLISHAGHIFFIPET
jgi:hypothetical protein